MDSTTHLATDISNAFEKNQKLGALFVDIQGAFNYVIPNILIQDLVNMKVSSKIIKFIKFLVSKRVVSFYTYSNHIEDAIVIKDLPQGSVLSHLLFNIYLRKIEHHLNLCINYQFADDKLHINLETNKK